MDVFPNLYKAILRGLAGIPFGQRQGQVEMAVYRFEMSSHDSDNGNKLFEMCTKVQQTKLKLGTYVWQMSEWPLVEVP